MSFCCTVFEVFVFLSVCVSISWKDKQTVERFFYFSLYLLEFDKQKLFSLKQYFFVDLSVIKYLGIYKGLKNGIFGKRSKGKMNYSGKLSKQFAGIL